MSQTEEEKKYTSMQKDWYEGNANNSKYGDGVCIIDAIVGNFPHQEKFPYESWLFKHYEPKPDHICYEYGCGPGRQIRRMLPHFNRVDGVDISKKNLENAKDYIGYNYNGILVENDGTSVPLNDKYDFCYSVICLQHIPSYSIRRKILDNMYESLKDGGSICIQLAFGVSINNTPTYGYYEDFYDADVTNGRADCRVDNINEVMEDFANIGFKYICTEFSETVEDHHPKWIWIYGTR